MLNLNAIKNQVATVKKENSERKFATQFGFDQESIMKDYRILVLDVATSDERREAEIREFRTLVSYGGNKNVPYVGSPSFHSTAPKIGYGATSSSKPISVLNTVDSETLVGRITLFANSFVIEDRFILQTEGQYFGVHAKIHFKGKASKALKNGVNIVPDPYVKDAHIIKLAGDDAWLNSIEEVVKHCIQGKLSESFCSAVIYRSFRPITKAELPSIQASVNVNTMTFVMVELETTPQGLWYVSRSAHEAYKATEEKARAATLHHYR